MPRQSRLYGSYKSDSGEEDTASLVHYGYLVSCICGDILEATLQILERTFLQPIVTYGSNFDGFGGKNATTIILKNARVMMSISMDVMWQALIPKESFARE